jgi:hypothetical protein
MMDDVQGNASGGRDMNNPMQAEGAAWGSDTVNGERPTANGKTNHKKSGRPS